MPTSTRYRPWARLGLSLALTVLAGIGLPLLGACFGAWLGAGCNGQVLSGHGVFPLRPEAAPVPGADAVFSPAVFTILGLLALGLLAIVGFLLWPRHATTASPVRSRHRLPGWGWLALCSLVLCWYLAWDGGIASLVSSGTGTDQQVRALLFTPLWLSFIVLVNAEHYRRHGTCLLCARPGRFLLLFPASMVFWWYFEYLNSYTHNWYYQGVEGFGPLAYTIYASLAYSTVLPALASTTHWLAGLRVFQHGYTRPLLPSPHPRRNALLWLLCAALSLFATGAWPDYSFALIWAAPVIVLLALQRLSGQSTYLTALYQGQWSRLGLPALAGLGCGFLWEMWNSQAAAKWHYAIPFVDRYHLFEMPMLGYAGYLPFGISCAVIIALLLPHFADNTLSGGTPL